MSENFESSYETTVHAPVDKVWEALTVPSLVKQYFFGSDLVTNWEIGQPIYFRGSWYGLAYEEKGIVKEYKYLDKLTYSYLSSWSGKDDAPENYLLVTYDVKSVKEGTKLTVFQTNYDAEKAEHSKANWKMVFDGLKKLVE